jgi:hypothetical protein
LDPVLPSVVKLENGVTVTDTIPTGPTMDYYKFESSPEAVESRVLLEPQDGNVDLYIRKELPNDPAPLPTINNFDYESANLNLTPDEIIITIDSSVSEFPLEPGTWYVGVLNRDNVDVTYGITWTETLAPVTMLEDGVNQPGNNPTGLTYDYYYIDVPADAVRADFEVLNPTGEVYLDIKKGQIPFYPLVSGFPVIADYSDFEPPGIVDRLVTVRKAAGTQSSLELAGPGFAPQPARVRGAVSIAFTRGENSQLACTGYLSWLGA